MREACATCNHCGEEIALSSLNHNYDPGTNGYEEDTVSYRCPECKKRVTDALVWTRAKE